MLLVNETIDFVKEYDTDAIASYKKLKALPGMQAFRTRLIRIGKMLDEYAFEESLDELEALKEEIGHKAT